VLYRFHGRPGVRLTSTGPAAPVGETVAVGHLTDGDDYIVLAAEAETETKLLTTLRTATATTAQLMHQHVPVDVTMPADDTERAPLLSRLLERASINERHEVTRRRKVPVARLRPHYKPAGRSAAFSGIRLP
jgi:hypothetical protein